MVLQTASLAAGAPTGFAERASPGSTMYVAAGRRLYVIGDIDGRFRPRTNPYDLKKFGHAQPDDPLAGKLQGVWAQPVKGLSGYQFVIGNGSERWPLDDADAFVQGFSHVELRFRAGGLSAGRVDFVPDDRAVLLTTLTVRNEGDAAVDLELVFHGQFELVDGWFTSLAEQRNERETAVVDGRRLVARAEVAAERWAVAVGCAPEPSAARVFTGSDRRPVGELTHPVRLAPNQEHSWTVAISVESQAGAAGALRELDAVLPAAPELLRDKRARVTAFRDRGPRLHAPDARFSAAFDAARYNLLLLEAEAPALGRYFYAGLENFPFYFSNDGAYATPGLLAAGFAHTTSNHARIGHLKATAGHIPHQVSPSGRIAGAGNTQESSLWVMALWDLYRWTGDRSLIAQLYPTAVAAVFDYTLGSANPDGDGYPVGQGMVERLDMVDKNLDSACYLWAALRSLGELANVQNDGAVAERARVAAAEIARRFEADWWDAEHGTYAAALERATRKRKPAPQWTVIVPLEVGLATKEHARATLAALRRGYVDLGLFQGIGSKTSFGGLGAGTLSRAAYRYDEPELGFEILGRLPESLEHGAIGMFHELIPDEFCFIQLWSAATFVRGVVEDMLGIHVDADAHRLTFAPHLPAAWDHCELEALRFGEHVVTAHVSRDDVGVVHVAGPTPLQITLRANARQDAVFMVRPGDRCRMP